MGQDTKDIFQGKKFKWSNMFSGFNSVKTKEEKERQFMSGLPGNVPYESDMIQEWTPPFLFYKFFIYSLVMLVLIFVCGYMYGFGKALLVSAAPYMIPVTILIFIWELNIPRNISVMDLLYIAVFSGITSYFVIFFCAGCHRNRIYGYFRFCGSAAHGCGKNAPRMHLFKEEEQRLRVKRSGSRRSGRSRLCDFDIGG